MTLVTKATPTSWLGFELNILRRLDFKSIAMPFTGEPTLGAYLKRREVRVLANDLLQSSWTKAVAAIQNNGERLSDEDVNNVLEDVYVPRHKLNNPALRTWFNETDSWWFDNVRRNLERLQSPISFAVGASLAMAVGDYVMSFNADTLELRQPLSTVYRRLWTILPEPINNGQNNTCQNKTPNEFIAESFADLMFLRLPSSGAGSMRGLSDRMLWREEWLRGGDDFWGDVEQTRIGKLGMPIETKSQYLRLFEETLRTASHIKSWAIAHVESGFISTQDLVEVIGRIRRVDTIYTKDFSELTGTKAVIITA
ncbi:MAG TPA: hypothetical protein VJV05_09650 [Pyrinomonadaceae bacterium]|nr:hypothetical protein [Pyrinomonadaceae bacterium]